MTEQNETQLNSLLPFLKWAGGKRWLVRENSHLFPTDYSRYIEPFLGGGAIFFHLQPQNAILSDANADLIDTYRAIKHDWKQIWKALHTHQKLHDKEYYYKIRDSSPETPAAKAARFIYLNRTCWNGLYRVNKKGKFNVPKGTKEAVIFGHDDFKAISELLKVATLSTGDFEKVISVAGDGDFIYADPPYTVQHNNNNFVKYNEPMFSWRDQIRLRNALYNASAHGAQVILSNADHPSIRNLYQDFGQIHQVYRYSVLAADPKKRRRTTELIITNHF